MSKQETNLSISNNRTGMDLNTPHGRAQNAFDQVVDLSHTNNGLHVARNFESGLNRSPQGTTIFDGDEASKPNISLRQKRLEQSAIARAGRDERHEQNRNIFHGKRGKHGFVNGLPLGVSSNDSPEHSGRKKGSKKNRRK